VDLTETLIEFSDDPLGFVIFSFPWGEPGELADQLGPEAWQEKLLSDVGARLRTGEIDLAGAIQMARTSGHGIGKSACVSWIILWAISTFPDTKGVVTANTENQLKTKTWVELAKWYRLFIGRDLFKMTATALFSADPAHERTWRIDMVPWSERNTEAFAGLHNQGKRILVIFDEASAIPDIIWETTEGALTDKNTQILWCVFGNPTRNKGRFRECFAGGRFSHRWSYAAIDSREVTITDKAQIQRWVDDYGEDSDFVRVRVRGVFPRVDTESFISLDLVLRAVNREILPQRGSVVLGVDVGRFGDDPSVIYPRCGADASSRPIEILPGLDTMATAGKVATAFLRHKASIVFVDEGGVGGGVVDRLRQLQIPVYGVDFGSGPDGVNPDDGTKYANKRAEIWGAMREWLKTGSIPDIPTGENTTLASELTGPGYGLNKKEEILLESKQDMRKRKVPSPNVADALACTFAMPHLAFTVEDAEEFAMEAPAVASDYNPFAQETLWA
jgi:hypothetical protein